MNDTLTRKAFPVQVKTVGDRRVETIASTGALDRENDRILPTAWRLDAYRRNPVVLANHDYTALPVARSISVGVRAGKLVTVDEFPPLGVYGFADTLYGLVKAGFVNSKSVGFRPLKWRPNDEGGRDYTDVELLEHSFVTVGCNPEALIVARSKGLDRGRLDAFLRGATRDLGEDIGLEAIPYAAVARALDVVTAADVRAALRSPEVRSWLGHEVRRATWAASGAHVLILDHEREAFGVGRDGVRGDGRRYNARTGAWELL